MFAWLWQFYSIDVSRYHTASTTSDLFCNNTGVVRHNCTHIAKTTGSNACGNVNSTDVGCDVPSEAGAWTKLFFDIFAWRGTSATTPSRPCQKPVVRLRDWLTMVSWNDTFVYQWKDPCCLASSQRWSWTAAASKSHETPGGRANRPWSIPMSSRMCPGVFRVQPVPRRPEGCQTDLYQICDRFMVARARLGAFHEPHVWPFLARRRDTPMLTWAIVSSFYFCESGPESS